MSGHFLQAEETSQISYIGKGTQRKEPERGKEGIESHRIRKHNCLLAFGLYLTDHLAYPKIYMMEM